jgi:hypothetical protein
MNMQIKDFFKSAIPHFIAIAAFLIISVVYFYPVLEGKVLKANDSMVAKISAK